MHVKSYDCFVECELYIYVCLYCYLCKNVVVPHHFNCDYLCTPCFSMIFILFQLEFCLKSPLPQQLPGISKVMSVDVSVAPNQVCTPPQTCILGDSTNAKLGPSSWINNQANLDHDEGPLYIFIEFTYPITHPHLVVGVCWCYTPRNFLAAEPT